MPEVQVMTRNLTGAQESVTERLLCNTAEPSGEVSKGDVVSAGEIALAVAGAGWTPVRGGLTEVRTDEHGTHPLPPVSPRKEQAHE
jgi:hypothetical protein